MSEVHPKPRKPQNGAKQSGRGKGGGAAKAGGVPRDQLTAQQRNALKEVRNVIKDQATDEQILSMLTDHNNDCKYVIRHIVENGPDDGWSDVSSKSKKRRDAEEATRDRGGGRGSTGKGGGRSRDDQSGRSNEARSRPTPKAAGTKLPTPAPPLTAPTNTAPPQPTPAGKSWASLARGTNDTGPGWGEPEFSHGLDHTQVTGAPPLFESMMQAEREREARTAHHIASSADATTDAVPVTAALPTPTPKPVRQDPPPPQTPTTQPSATQLFESRVTTQTAPSIVGAEGCVNHQHQGEFIQSLLSMWDRRLLCDLRLIPTAENKSNDVCISVHSAVIAAASAEIQKILISCLQNNGTLPPDLVVHVETNALEELVRYMYTGELRIHDESVSNIMHAAETLGVQSATDLCVHFLRRNITAGNALSVSDMAIRFNRPELKQAVEGYLLKNIQHLVQESDFLEQPVERVKELLSSDDAHFQSEVDVFHAVVRWVRHDIKNRSQMFAQLMAETVRLPLMTPEQLLDDVEGEELVRSDRSAQSLVFETYRYQALPESRRDTMEIRGTHMRRTNLQNPYY
jgi:hypothetical protein